MKLELKSIGYWSVVKIAFVVNLVVGAIIGFFIGVFMSFFMALASEMGELGGTPLPFFEDSGTGGIVMIIMMVFLYGFLGAIFNTILCIIGTFIYNMAAKLLGGIELEFAEVPVPMPPYAYGTYQPGQPSAPPYYAPPQRPTPPPPPPPVQPMPPDMKPPEEKG